MHLNQRPETRRTRAVTLVALIVLSLGVVTMSSASAAVDPLPPAPAPTDQTWIVTLVGNADAPRGTRLVQREGGQLLAASTRTFSTGSRSPVPRRPRPRSRATRASPTSSCPHAARGRRYAPNGILRTSAWAAHGAGYTGVTSGGTPVRVAVVDTGIKLDHVDLAANIAPGLGTNCINPGQPANDDHGHGTHVAGTVAAAFNGQGVVGMATNAQLIPVKVLNSTGFGTDAQVICGLDYVAAARAVAARPLRREHEPRRPEPPGETTCGSSALHQAICGLNERRGDRGRGCRATTAATPPASCPRRTTR